MGGYLQKGIGIDTTHPGSIGGFQYSKRKDNEGINGCIG
jgi:hypothetical protein